MQNYREGDKQRSNSAKPQTGWQDSTWLPRVWGKEAAGKNGNGEKEPIKAWLGEHSRERNLANVWALRGMWMWCGSHSQCLSTPWDWMRCGSQPLENAYFQWSWALQLSIYFYINKLPNNCNFAAEGVSVPKTVRKSVSPWLWHTGGGGGLLMEGLVGVGL